MKKWNGPGAAVFVMALAAALAFYGAVRYRPGIQPENQPGIQQENQPENQQENQPGIQPESAEAEDSGGKAESGGGKAETGGDGTGKNVKNLWEIEFGAKNAWLYEQKTTPTKPELPVSEGEEKLLTDLYGFLEKKDMVRAAELLNENQEQLKVLVNKTFADETLLFYTERTAQGEILYRMRRMEPGVFGKGMVLTRFNTVFFGSFSDGVPEGECLAVQTVILDYPRYTFADGIWEIGKMNGEGRTGYRYYAGKPEGSFESILKTGNFADNLMDGDLVYEADNGSGRVLHWNIRAERGVTVLDENWTWYAFSGEYMLRSEEDEDRAYVIPEETKEQIRWNNLILWEN